jgi:hypothetical protein
MLSPAIPTSHLGHCYSLLTSPSSSCLLSAQQLWWNTFWRWPSGHLRTHLLSKPSWLSWKWYHFGLTHYKCTYLWCTIWHFDVQVHFRHSHASALLDCLPFPTWNVLPQRPTCPFPHLLEPTSYLPLPCSRWPLWPLRLQLQPPPPPFFSLFFFGPNTFPSTEVHFLPVSSWSYLQNGSPAKAEWLAAVAAARSLALIGAKSWVRLKVFAEWMNWVFSMCHLNRVKL